MTLRILWVKNCTSDSVNWLLAILSTPTTVVSYVLLSMVNGYDKILVFPFPANVLLSVILFPFTLFLSFPLPLSCIRKGNKGIFMNSSLFYTLTPLKSKLRRFNWVSTKPSLLLSVERPYRCLVETNT